MARVQHILIIQFVVSAVFFSNVDATTSEGLCNSQNKKLDRFCEDMERGTYFDDEMINVCLWGGQSNVGISTSHNVDGHVCIEQFKNMVFPKDTLAKCGKPSTWEQRFACLEEKNARPISSLSETEIAELGVEKLKNSGPGTATAVIRLLQKRAEKSEKKAVSCESQMAALKESSSSPSAGIYGGEIKKTTDQVGRYFEIRDVQKAAPGK